MAAGETMRRSKAHDSTGRRRAGVRLGGDRAASRQQPRTCVGCRKPGDKDELVRCVLAPDGRLIPDLKGSSFGRGAWVHPALACLKKAVPVGFARSFKARPTSSAADLVRALRAAGDQRVLGLVGAAKRARALAIGADAVAEALSDRKAALVIVAADARAAAETRGVSDAIAEGRAVVWGTKTTFGTAVGRTEVGVAAVLDHGLATATKRAVALAQMPASGIDEVDQSASMEAR